ncbi:MAG: glycosyltransferase [Candidatus Goldiibacteriota bacterium]
MEFKKLSVLMPMYNEELGAAANIMETDAYFKQSGIKYEIIVMDDGSKDMTYDSAMKASREHIRVYKLQKNEGKGEALRMAFNNCSGDLVMFLDGDLDLLVEVETDG